MVVWIFFEAVWRIGTGLDENTDPQSQRADGIVPSSTEAHSRQCFFDGTPDSDVCEQKWVLYITPTTCDVSGSYLIQFWTACTNLTSTDNCGLDMALDGSPFDPDCDSWSYDSGNDLYTCASGTIAGTTRSTNPAASNSKISFEFDVNAQSFCPEVIDEIFISSSMSVYTDAAVTS